ncbi:aKG-HExxH-type peptide beta-hydroxylase [Streptomyces roseicoloratus]|uniref:HEXXH motif-containing putative peptide modification protein n=1 Tax=Streptomyces roseicoloratus TaxID=2508722 RepID=A0ABY9RSE8_9ACTN|nr:HEXXH motif-containing putative peptide modification protein [Streptomyces roseicoloratus]WMX45100.1 HEXXH motif-containing putative peptide modification protein [Streptomyces roseicoloratus]
MTFAGPHAEALTELARTRSAVSSAALLSSALHARRLLLLKALLVRVQRHRDGVDGAAYRRFGAAWQLLERAERRRPDVVRDLLDYPTTGGWLAAALAEPVGPALDRHLARLDVLAVTAALRSGCPVNTTVDAPGGLLALPGVGRLRAGASRVRIRSDSRTGRVRPDVPGHAPPVVLLLTDPRTGALAGRGPGWSGLHVLSGSAARLDDMDPYRVPAGGIGSPPRGAEDHGTTDRAAWSARWESGLDLLHRTDPDRAGEVRRAVRALVPLVARGPGAFGATMSAAPGAVLTSLPAGAEDMAETLVHELHHSKMATLHELVPLYRPGRAAVHRVGWRADPRPIPGVMHGTYAHLALTDLWRRAAVAEGVPAAWRIRAGQQFDRIYDQVGEGLAILLESDELTSEGRKFARQMGRHHASLGAAPGATGSHCAHGT